VNVVLFNTLIDEKSVNIVFFNTIIDEKSVYAVLFNTTIDAFNVDGGEKSVINDPFFVSSSAPIAPRHPSTLNQF
jgi:hypothetical protein